MTTPTCPHDVPYSHDCDCIENLKRWEVWAKITNDYAEMVDDYDKLVDEWRKMCLGLLCVVLPFSIVALLISLFSTL